MSLGLIERNLFPRRSFSSIEKYSPIVPIDVTSIRTSSSFTRREPSSYETARLYPDRAKGRKYYSSVRVNRVNANREPRKSHDRRTNRPNGRLKYNEGPSIKEEMIKMFYRTRVTAPLNGPLFTLAYLLAVPVI